MSWIDRLRSAFRGPGGFDGVSGAPPSANGASSFHLFWDAPPGDWVGAEATLEVVERPAVPALYFWALQVSFEDHGHETGGAHTGLQWYPPHPGSTAVNWGGYRTGGGILDGSASPLPSAVGNPNTRDFPWAPGRRYRFCVEGVVDGRDTTAWRSTVTDLDTGQATVIRDLFAPGDRVSRPMVWAEVFAACDDPPVTVRWSDFALLAPTGARTPVRSVSVNYQALQDGGCLRTDVAVAGDGRSFVQRTNTARRTPQGARLTLATP